MSSVVGESGGGYFRLDQHADQLVFATDKEIEQNVRFQMLQLRKNKVPEFKNYRMIPASENEIPRGILEAREKRYLIFSIIGQNNVNEALRTITTVH